MTHQQSRKDDGENQCQSILRLTEDFRLFMSMEAVPFFQVQQNSHTITWPIKSEKARKIISGRFLEEFNNLPDGKNIEKVLDTLSYHAETRTKEPVFVRVAKKDDRLFIDLADENCHYIEVSETEWLLKNDPPPVNFLRSQTMRPLPLPSKGGDIFSLRKFLNLASDKDFNLFLAYLVGILFHGKQYPIAIFQGPQGSAKSTTTEIIKELIDPGSPSLRSIPSKEEDIFIAAKNTHLICFDNLSGIPAKVSDTLCKVSTGGAISGRKLYSNDEEYFIEISRPTIINGIDDLTERPDLSDRAIVFNLPKVDERQRIQASKIWRDFQKEKSAFFGCLLDALVCALKDRESITLSKKPRMVDFCLTACAGLQAFGYAPETTLEAFLENRQEVAVDTLEANPVGRIISYFMANKTYWRGSATEILVEVRDTNNDLLSFLSQSSRNPSCFSKELRRIAPSLKLQGIDFLDDRKSTKRAIILQKSTSSPSLPTQIVLNDSFGPTMTPDDGGDTNDTNLSTEGEA